jgi:hypothetical protein
MAFDTVARERVHLQTSETSSSPLRQSITFLLLCAVILPAIVAFAILQRRSLPVPYQDDYNAILNFASRYNQLPTSTAKMMQVATAQHNEYKLVFEHLLFVSELSLTHHLNFAFLTTVGNLFLLPIGYLLWRTYQGDEKELYQRLLGFLPISLLFFSLTYWETLNWAMTSLQQLPVVFFSLLSIYLLFEKEASRVTPFRFFLACFAAVLACCSSANGFLLLPVGLLILIPRRAYVQSLGWAASFVLPLVAYLYRYSPAPDEHSHRTAYYTRPLEFLAVLGGVFPFRTVAALAGLAMLGVIGLAIRSRFDRTNPVSFYFTLWVVGTASMIGWVRGVDFFGHSSRYTMYSLLMLIFCYAFFSHVLRERGSKFNVRRFYAASVVFAVIVCAFGDIWADKKLEARRQMVFTGLEFYRSNPSVNSPMIDPAVERVFKQEKPLEKAALTEAIQTGIFTLPPRLEVH